MNLFETSPLPAPGSEHTTLLHQSGGCRVEKIVSHLCHSDFWYDQAEDELVFLLAGDCVLEVERSPIVPANTAPPAAGVSAKRPEHTREIPLSAGEQIFLPARLRHRVKSAGLTSPAVFLCLFTPPEGRGL